MGTRRNELCSCNSGLKYKKCCLEKQKPKSERVLIRKYMSEFALNSFSSKVRLSYPNHLEEKDPLNGNYHIYMINKIKRLSFVKDSLRICADYGEVEIKRGINEDCVTFEKVSFPIEPLKKYSLSGDKHFVIDDSNQDQPNQLGILEFCYRFSKSFLECEILYIGQSFGKKGERNALTRLKSHETLQKILTDVSYTDIDSELVITLWEFSPILLSSFDGRNEYLVSDKEDKVHLRNVINSSLSMDDKQIVNVTEAALINYFKPEYNEKFKSNFPDINHKGYKYYYDYDYNSIIVELDPSCIRLSIFSKHTNYSQFNPIKYLLNTEEQRRSMFTY